MAVDPSGPHGGHHFIYTTSTTVEAFIPATGKALQGGTSHCLGQNFSVIWRDEKGTRRRGGAVAVDPSGAHGGHVTTLFCKLPVPTKISTLRNVLPI